MLLFIKKIYQYYRSQSTIMRFFVNGLLLYLIWGLFYISFRNFDFVNYFYQSGTKYLTNSLLYSSEAFLKLFGYDTNVYPEQKILHVIGSRGVRLDLGCLGRNLMGLFAGFILAFPGSIKSKSWFIPSGLVMILGINIIRILVLSLTLLYSPEGYFQYNHHDIFKYTVFVMIFLMWLFWIKRYSVVSHGIKKKPLTITFQAKSPVSQMIK